MSAAAPTISVIMPAYRGAAIVIETLESVARQSFPDFEVVIVDDCSPDDTLTVLCAFPDPRIRVVESQTNGGPVVARNRAFAAARGRYIAALDQDDLCHPERFARQVAYLDAHPETVLVATAASLLEDGVLRPGRPPRETSPGLIDWLLHLGNPLTWSSVMFRGDAARKLDPFTRPDLLYAEDYDLYHRLRPFGRIARIDEELTVYRCHAGGVSKQFETHMFASAEQVIAAAHRPIFGDEAETTAALTLRHIAARIPVEDRATLDRLTAILTSLADHFAAADPDAAALIRSEASRIWWEIARTAVRAGQLGLSGALSARPQSARLRDARSADMLVSGLIGRGRALARATRR